MEDSKFLVQLKDRYIDVIWIGHITKEMARACDEEIVAAADKLKAKNKPVLVRFSVVNPPALPNTDAFAEGLKISTAGIPFDRVVIWGDLPRLARLLVDVLIDSYKEEFKVRYIEDEQEALSWLLQD